MATKRRYSVEFKKETVRRVSKVDALPSWDSPQLGLPLEERSDFRVRGEAFGIVYAEESVVEGCFDLLFPSKFAGGFKEKKTA